MDVFGTWSSRQMLSRSWLFLLVVGSLCGQGTRVLAQQTAGGAPSVAPVGKPAKVSPTKAVAGKMAMPTSEAEISEQIRAISSEAKAAQDSFVEEQRRLRSRLREAADAERAKIREQIQFAQASFLEKQREAREEIRRRVDALKSQLKDHTEVLDQAKEQTRDRIRDRKGGD